MNKKFNNKDIVKVKIKTKKIVLPIIVFYYDFYHI